MFFGQTRLRKRILEKLLTLYFYVNTFRKKYVVIAVSKKYVEISEIFDVWLETFTFLSKNRAAKTVW